MLALAGGIAAAADGHAEAGHDQGAGEQGHRAGIAGDQPLGCCEQSLLILLQQMKR